MKGEPSSIMELIRAEFAALENDDKDYDIVAAVLVLACRVEALKRKLGDVLHEREVRS